MLFIVLAVLLLVSVSPVLAGSWALTSTPEEDKGFRWVLDGLPNLDNPNAVNKQRAKQNLPPFTELEYFQSLFKQAMTSYVGQMIRAQEEKMADEARRCGAAGKTWIVKPGPIGTCQP